MRPIDADSLVASLEESYKELRNLYDEIEDGGGAKEVYQGELITFLEAILRVKNAPTLDYAPVRHASWIRQDDTYTRFQCGECKSKNFDRRWVFCPLCGALMDGGKKDD